MKALILVGGYGTRLRPLTLTRPKPLVDFCNKPIILHQMEALVTHGVDTIVLAVSYMCDMLEQKIKEFAQQNKVNVLFSRETEPLGTGGPLALARNYLEGNDPFFVLNSDVICQYPLSSMLDYHSSKGAEATIAVTPVDEPSKYGVVVSDENGCALRFLEKPTTFVSNKINAGIYVLNPSVLDRIELRPTSIEKEVFPAIAKDRALFAFNLEGFWMDIGQPPDYLTGSRLFLTHLAQRYPNLLGFTPDGLYGTSMIHSTAKIGSGCCIEDTVIGKNVVVGDGVCLRGSVIFSDAVINSYTLIEKSLVGWHCNIGRWVRIQGCSVLGENVTVDDEAFISGSKILPHKTIANSIICSQIIM